jgi:hypothetical protein
VLALVRLLAAFPELAHHGNCFLQHLEADIRRWPPVAVDVLVEGFAASHAEREPSGQHRRRRRRRVGHDRRVRANKRACHRRPDPKIGGGGDPANH